MFWKYGLFFSILSGGIWGIFWQIFFTVVGILTLGTPLSLELSQIMIIGPLAGILYIKSQKFLSIKFHLTAIIIITFLIFISHLGNPYQAEDGIRDLVRSRGLGDVYKRQVKYNRIVGMVTLHLFWLRHILPQEKTAYEQE